MRNETLRTYLNTAVLAVFALLLGAYGAAAQQQVNLAAGPAGITLPDGSAVPMWGYSCGTLVTGSAATCAALNPSASTALGAIVVTNGGSGYTTAPGVTIGAPTAPTGTLTQAVAVATIANGKVTGITLTTPGSGYIAAPTVTIAGPGTGTTATASALLAWSPVVITVPTGVAGGLQINLTNNLVFPTTGATNYIPTSLVIAGQLGGGLGTAATYTPSPLHPTQTQTTWPIVGAATNTPPSQGPRVQSFATEVAAAGAGLTGKQVASGSPLTWGALQPGTYLLESGTHPSIQVPMGLYGILVVTCAPGATACVGVSPGTAYPTGSVTGQPVTYNAEVPLEFSEIDPVQNNSVFAAVNTAGFNETATFALYAPSPVASINVLTGGSGYTTPTVAVQINGGGGTGASATANVDLTPGSPTLGQVIGVTLNAAGTGYTSPPLVVIASPPAGGTQATALAALVPTPNSLAYCLSTSGATVAACYPPAVNYAPLYFLINGVAFDKSRSTATVSPSLFPTLPATGITPGTGTVLVRLVNAGLRMHVPSIVGAQTTQTVGGVASVLPGFSIIAEDGNIAPGVPKVQSDVFMAAGKTFDLMVNAPTTGAALGVFDRQLSLSGNSIARDAGMLAYISVNGGTIGTIVGISTSPTAPAVLVAAAANADSYSSILPCTVAPCAAFTVSDASKGVIANDVNVYGVALTTAPTLGTVTLATNGTFTYTPNAGFAASSVDTFGYCANGTTTACTTVTLSAATIEAASSILMNNITYTSSQATYISIKPPGVLSVDKDTAGYPLTVALSTVSGLAACTSANIAPCITMDAKGGFNAFVPAHTAATSYTFTYQAQNAQGTLSATSAQVTLNFPAPSNLLVTVLDAQDKVTQIADYRWVIEEDRTFFVDPKCQVNPPPAGCPGSPGMAASTFGVNFSTGYLPYVAQGCTGPLSCESGQTMGGVPVVCDVGNGNCRPGTQLTAVDPSQVVLDPSKRYFISVLPGDAYVSFLGGTPSHGMSGASIPVPTCGLVGTVLTCIAPGTGARCTPVSPATTCMPPVTVLAQPTPFPPGKLSIMVFEDDFPLNGEQDSGGGIDVISPNEPGLGGFNIVIWDDMGQPGDVTGQMTYDMFNQPLSNSLSGTIDPITGLDACPISPLITNNVTKGDGTQAGITGTIVTCPKYESDGRTLSPLAGQAVVANLMPGRFSVQAYPGADRIAAGEEWLQTNTLDGQHPHDAFIRIGEPAYFQEYGPAGYHDTIGFANPKIINDRYPAVCAGQYGTVGACNNTITGQITGTRFGRIPDERLYSSGSRDQFYFTQCYVSLGDPDAEDFMFTKCDANGNFTFANVPGGNWRLTIFDQWNDQIVDGLSTPANVSGGQTLNMGQINVQQWQANVYTRTFVDDNKDGLYQSTELGIPFLNTTVRYRDGSLGNNLLTDFDGVANFNETFPLFSWYAVEADTTRYKTTGIHTVYDAGGPADWGPMPNATNTGTVTCTPTSNPPCGTSTIGKFLANTMELVSLPPALRVPGAVYCNNADCTGYSILNGPGSSASANCTLAAPSATSFGGWSCAPPYLSTGRIDPPWVAAEGWQGFWSHNNFIEFGKAPYAAAVKDASTGNITTPAENGGVHGHVIYASTRPFDDPQMLVQTQWEPLVPHVTMNLYKEDFAADGITPILTLVDTTQTTSWDDWAQGFRSDNIPYMNCPGQSAADLFYFTLFNQPNYLNLYNSVHGGPAVTQLPYNSQFKCYDGMHNWNQLQPAPYDGMYSFPSVLGIVPSGANAGKQDTSLTGGVGAHVVNGVTTYTTNANMPGTNCTICVQNPDTTDPWRVGTPMLPAGKYVVEVVLPPGFELVKEEDKNILIGDAFIAPVTQEFGALAMIFIMPDQASVAAVNNPTLGYNANNAQNPTQNLGAVPRTQFVPGFIEPVWPCVGEAHVVPDFISLFPQSMEVAPFAGAIRNLCDRKEVKLTDQMSVTAKFYIFTSTHIATKFTGVITDDFTSEFDPFAPAFGEKFAPANLPVSVRDYAGNEINRIYSDGFGLYNGVGYSTWEVNPPNPTGYSPTMMIMCMNDPGPIVDTRPTIVNGLGQTVNNPTFGQLITDPLFNPAYSDFCYELPFMPGTTDYMDTPVTPDEAFSAGYNHPDCMYPDATPAIASVTGDVAGPWVSQAGHTITITALGDQQVQNFGYSGPSANAPPFNQKTTNRHFGFGTAAGKVTIGGVAATVTGGWSDTKLTVTVPNVGSKGVPPCPIQQQNIYGGSPAWCGELVITTAPSTNYPNGQQSIDAVTVTIGGKAPTILAAGHTIQSAIDAAMPGDLIIVPPGTYTEMLIMWHPVRLQGVGAATTLINANAQPAGLLLDPWRRQVNCIFGLTLEGVPIDASHPFDATGAYHCPGAPGDVPGTMYFSADRLPLEAMVGWTATLNGNIAELLQEPSLLGAYEGAGITVMGKGVDYHGAYPWNDGTEAGAYPPVTTLLTVANCTVNVQGKGITNPFPSNFQCNPSSIDGLSFMNSSQGGGGMFVHGWAHNLQIANNRVYNNTGTLSGGISIGQGEFAPGYFQGGATNAAPGSCMVKADGSPLTLLNGQQQPYCLDLNVNVHNNSVSLNSSIGDELFSATLAGAGGITINTGSDYYKLTNNWVCGNMSTGDGGGVAHQGFIFNGDIEHNWILFNQSLNPTIPTNGGGILIYGTPDTDPVCGIIPDADCPPGLSDGIGPGLIINANLIQGNAAESGSGGGLRFQGVNGTEVPTFFSQPYLWYSVDVTNNIIVNNVAGWDGAGVSLQDALVINLINNTIASNDTTASAGVLNQTLGAPLASVPPNNTNLLFNSVTSAPQTAGLVSIQNTALLTTTFSGVPSITCPAGHYAPNTGAVNGTCTEISYPFMYNNLFWQNRAFDIGVGAYSANYQQAVVTMYDAFTTVKAPNQTSTGQCTAGSTNIGGVYYWDIGVRGDVTNVANSGSGYKLNPMYSVLTTTSGYSSTNTSNNPSVLSQYCNGSRFPPELCTSLAPGTPCAPGWSVPPGISDAVVPNPVFSLTPAATVDEGNNWINLTWGPLALTNPSVKGADGNYGGGAPLGNYSIAPTSPAVNFVSVRLPHPLTDFFGNARPDPANINCFDVGAVEIPGATANPCSAPTLTPTLSSISPNSGTHGTTVQVTLLGTNFEPSGTTVNVSGTRVTVSNVAVDLTGTQITATFTIANNAATGTRTVTVTTASGTSNSVTFVIN